MNWKIQAGVLFAENHRIVLAAVTDYRVEMQTVIVGVGTRTISINAGTGAAELGRELDAHSARRVDHEKVKNLK
jgi:hypothetical protein